jgi:hypothetical protein
MTSQIDYSGIDENYPVAGQDNNSQGFRDNFLYIKEGLTQASTEITDLQNNTAKLNADNNFYQSRIENAIFKANFGFVKSEGTITGNLTLITSEAEYFTLTVNSGGTITITFGDWPDDNDYPLLREITLEIYSSGTSRQVNFASTGGGTIKKFGFAGFAGGNFVTGTNTENPHIIKAWTTNDGDLTFVQYIGQFS